MRRLIRSIGWCSSSCRSARPMHRSTPRFCAPSYLFWQLSCWRFLPAYSWPARMVVPIRALQRRRSADRQRRSQSAHIDQDRRRARGAWQPVQPHGGPASGIVCHARAQGRGAHEGARARQPRQVAFSGGGEPRSATAVACAGPVRRAAARTMKVGRTRPDCRSHRCRGGGNERAVQRAAGHLQARCRRADPELTEFPIAQLLKRIEATFAAAAREKGLSLRVVPSSAWVRSDFILLERILLNLVSNAVRYTADGGVVVGCRRRGGQLRIEVWDTGLGIPEDQRTRHLRRILSAAGARNVIGRRAWPRARDRRSPVPAARSSDRAGTRRWARDRALPCRCPRSPPWPRSRRRHRDASGDRCAGGKLVVVIDDDQPVLDGMGGLLRSWGCRVVMGDTDERRIG